MKTLKYYFIAALAALSIGSAQASFNWPFRQIQFFSDFIVAPVQRSYQGLCTKMKSLYTAWLKWRTGNPLPVPSDKDVIPNTLVAAYNAAQRNSYIEQQENQPLE